MQFTLNYEHFPRTIYGFLKFITSEDDELINASEDNVGVSHSVYYDIVQLDIGQFV
jgi:hypothetical protein